MKKKIFSGIFTICLTILMVCVFIVTTILYSYYTELQEESLRTELTYLVHMTESHDAEHIRSLDTPRHIIHLSSDGKVLQEIPSSDTSPSKSVTEAFEEAVSKGEGNASESVSIRDKKLCISTRLSDGSVLCITHTIRTYPSVLLNLMGYVLLVLVVAALLSLLLSYKLSQRILKPVNDLDLNYPARSKVYPELQPFIEKINIKNKQIKDHLTALEEEHKAQDKMRREFTANVSHELKTPLTSISGYAEIIRDGLVKPEDIPRFAGKIHDESNRMITLVGDIIKLSQLDENEINVKVERIDLYACCQAVLSSLESQAKKKNVTCTLSGDHAYITGAEIIVDEIVHNVIDNAIKYNKDGGTVQVRLNQCIDGVELTVTDTGIGIAKDDIDHIFDRFYRADKSHSKEIGGTGLGLSIVKHGAKFLGASVSVDSQVDVGTTIRILF